MKRLFTTLEQSAKLLELGLDPNTADCYIEVRDPFMPKFNPCNSFDELLKQTHWNALQCVPCWSGLCLLELMPVTLPGFFSDYDLIVNSSNVFYQIREWHPGRVAVWYEGEGEDTMSRLVNVVQRLLDNGDFPNQKHTDDE